MKADDIFGSCALVQPIHILSDQCELRIPAAPCREHFVSTVGSLRGKHLTPPVIPFPHKLWIFCERLRSGERFCPIFLPDSIGSTKCRNAAADTPAPVITVIRVPGWN